MSVTRHSDLTLYRRLLAQARPYWLHVAGIFGLSLLSMPLGLLGPIPLKIAVDSALGSEPLPPALTGLLGASAARQDAALVVAVGLLIGVYLLSQIQELASSVLRTYTADKLVLEFRAQLFRHVQRLSLSYHDSRGTADSLYRFQVDAPSIQYITIDGVTPFITSVATLLVMLYVIARLDWQLALVALTISPVLFLVSQASRRLQRNRSYELKELDSSALSVVQEALAAVRVVKAFGQERREQERFVRRASEGVRVRVRLALAEGVLGLLAGLATAVGTGVVLFIGVRHVQSGLLTLGELLLVMGYLAQLYMPLQIIGKRVESLQFQLASADRVYSVLNEPPDVPERPHARRLGRAAGRVTFRDVTFGYAPGRPVLEHISYEIAPGTRVSITGRTGAGKTTLLALLARFYDVTAGQILLDGIDIRDYRIADLRNQFAIVLQEPVLFSTSILENIAYARPGASEIEIREAATAAGVHDFILSLPEGYQTRVGERGMRLSGGERQRISLARAFLKNAPILLLDEPTSSVDAKTETTIIDAMSRLMQGCTTFLITHRESTLRHCDVHIQIEHGRLVETPQSAVAAGTEILEDGARLARSKSQAST